MNEAGDWAVVVALEFGRTGRSLTAELRLGQPACVALPVSISWPDGSRSDTVELLIEAMPEDGAGVIFH